MHRRAAVVLCAAHVPAAQTWTGERAMR